MHTKLFGLCSLFCLILLSNRPLQAQEYLGYSHSNYAGVHGIFTNPASIADNRYVVDVNVIGLSLSFENDFLKLRNKGFLGMGNFSESYADWTDFREKALFVDFDGTQRGETAKLYLGLDVMGPSALISLSPNDAIALGARYRVMTNFDDLGAEAARLAIDEFVVPPLWGRNFESDGASLDIMAWVEYFGSYGRVLWQDQNHLLKAGLTVKLMQGVAGMYMYADDLNYNFTNDDILTLQQSTLYYGHSENFEITEYNDLYFNFDALGIGADVGLIYEWRPDGAAYNGRTGEQKINKDDRSATRYKLKAGFSVMDIGAIRFNRDPDSYDRPIGSISVVDWDLTQVQFNSIQDFDDTLNNRFPTSVQSNETRFGMSLPTAINLFLDYQVYQGFYLGASAWMSPRGNNNFNKVHGVSRISLQPRYEMRWFEIGLPVSYQNFSGVDAGLYFRAGPVVFGSSNLLSKTFQDTIDGANIFMALKIPILFGRMTGSYGSGDSRS